MGRLEARTALWREMPHFQMWAGLRAAQKGQCHPCPWNALRRVPYVRGCQDIQGHDSPREAIPSTLSASVKD